MDLDESFSSSNKRFLRQICEAIKEELRDYVIVKMPKEIQKEHGQDPIGLSGTAYDEKQKKRVNIILLDEVWLSGLRGRYEQGDAPTKLGIRDTLQEIVLHEKAHSIGIRSEKKAWQYAEETRLHLGNHLADTDKQLSEGR